MVMLDGEETPRSDASGEGGGDPERELANFMPGEGGEEPGANRGAGEDAAGAGGSRARAARGRWRRWCKWDNRFDGRGFHVFSLVTVTVEQWTVSQPDCYCLCSSLPCFC